MAPLPYTHSAARIAFYVVLGSFAALEGIVRARSRLKPQGSPSDRHTRLLVYATVIAGFGAGFALASGVHGAAIGVARRPIFIAGLVLMAGGVALRQWAVLVLGRFFTTDVRVHAGQAVVDTGPYRWVRHPSYTGLLITLAGIGLALGNWGALAALVVLPAIGLVVRIRVEERALREALGEPYRRFADSRARLLPGVW
jgi:protein-S-isoprenylcysteine O-methyltransferase Ste14